MQLEDYFEFLTSEDIRIKGTRVGIEHIRPLAKILLIKFLDGLEAHPTRKKNS